MKGRSNHFRKVPPLNKFSDIQRQIENFPDIDAAIYSSYYAAKGYVYIALQSETNEHGYGGITVTEDEFNELKSQFGEKLQFIRKSR